MDPAAAGFLERPASWWREVDPHAASPVLLPQLVGYHGLRLARLGVLRPDEVERLERIAGGAEEHPWVTGEQAALILGRAVAVR